MSKPETSDRRAPIDTGKRVPVGMAVITYGSGDGREFAQCTCGWVGYHSRLKVLEDRIDAHLARKHGGAGMRF